jgi:hypothetical protein
LGIDPARYRTTADLVRAIDAARSGEQAPVDRSEKAQAVDAPMSVGVAPGSAEPVTVHDGTVYVGKHEAVNYDTGEPVTVPKGSTRADVAKALKDAGALSARQHTYGLGRQSEAVMFSRSKGGGGLPESAEPIFDYRNDIPLKRHPDYRAAKAGNVDAAARLVRDLVKPQSLEAARKLGPDVVYVPVHAEEASGRNKIPNALAMELASAGGARVDMNIVQTNKAFHTGAGAMERIANRAEFGGWIEPGQRYVLVDDVTTMGSTLADLAAYIQRNGGHVAGSVLMVNAARDGKIDASPKVINQLEARHGQAIRDTIGIGASQLTGPEAQYLIGFKSADELRNRAAKAELERVARLRSKEILSGRSHSEVASDASASRTIAASRAGGSLPVQEVSVIADAIKAKWANGPDVIVAHDMNDPKIPQAVRDADQQQRNSGAQGEIDGFYHDGKAYLIASQLHNPSDVARVLFHETLGHHGLHGVFGSSLDSILIDVAAMRRSEIVAKGADYGLLPEGLSADASLESKWQAMGKSARLHAAEEVLAEMAQAHPELGFVRRAAAAIRTWLRDNVPGLMNLRMTDDEIIRNFILPARRFVEQGPEQAGVGGRLAAAFSRGDEQDQPLRQASTFSEAREAAKDFQGKPLENKATGITAVVSRNQLDKMLNDKAVKKSETPAVHAMAVANADRLFERAILGWSKPDRDGDANIRAIHRFFAPMNVDGRAKLVKLTVKESVRQERDNPLYAVEAVELNDQLPGRQWV